MLLAKTSRRWSHAAGKSQNHSTAVTSKATEYERTGPCCTRADQHYYKVTVTLSGTGQIGWAQPGPGGNGISREAPVKVTLSSVATHGGRRYFSRLTFRFTWRDHTYAGTERFADPCGNTTGCWVTPGTPVA
jgi:hypothetical protein